MDPWKDKSSVLNQVTEKVNRITEFRQRQFQLKRQEISQAMIERERLEAEAEAKKIEKEEKKAQEEKAAAELEAANQAAVADGSEEKATSRDANNNSKVKSEISIEVPVNDDLIKEEAMKTLSSSKSLHSKH